MLIQTGGNGLATEMTRVLVLKDVFVGCDGPGSLDRYYVMTRNLQWFDFWLKGVTDSSIEFGDQFKRWEKMRDDWKARRAKKEQISGQNRVGGCAGTRHSHLEHKLIAFRSFMSLAIANAGVRLRSGLIPNALRHLG